MLYSAIVEHQWSTHSFCYLVAINRCCAQDGITSTEVGVSIE